MKFVQNEIAIALFDIAKAFCIGDYVIILDIAEQSRKFPIPWQIVLPGGKIFYTDGDYLVQHCQNGIVRGCKEIELKKIESGQPIVLGYSLPPKIRKIFDENEPIPNELIKRFQIEDKI